MQLYSSREELVARARNSMAAKRKKSDSSNNEGKDTFKWTDDEAELLLKVTRDYKVLKAAEGADWESIQSKYADILELMLAEYPDIECCKGLEQRLSAQEK